MRDVEQIGIQSSSLVQNTKGFAWISGSRFDVNVKSVLLIRLSVFFISPFSLIAWQRHNEWGWSNLSLVPRAQKLWISLFDWRIFTDTATPYCRLLQARLEGRMLDNYTIINKFLNLIYPKPRLSYACSRLHFHKNKEKLNFGKTGVAACISYQDDSVSIFSYWHFEWLKCCFYVLFSLRDCSLSISVNWDG